MTEKPTRRELEDEVIRLDPFAVMPMTRQLLAERDSDADDVIGDVERGLVDYRTETMREPQEVALPAMPVDWPSDARTLFGLPIVIDPSMPKGRFELRPVRPTTSR